LIANAQHIEKQHDLYKLGVRRGFAEGESILEYLEGTAHV